MKIILFIIILLSNLIHDTYAEVINEPEKPVIITREQWGADEEYTSKESSYWQKIIEAWNNYVPAYESPAAKIAREEKETKKIDYINENFGKENSVVEKVNNDEIEGYALAWPLKYTENVNAIVIHHTDSEYSSSLEGIKDIYRYHSINRQWGDIGYNYVIGYDGEIFEGRKGGDYVSAAHSKWNNYSTLGISVMGNYQDKEINAAQYESLEKLVRYMAWKYGIDFSKKYYYNMECYGTACNTFPLETHQDYTLAGHRDTGYTNCPGDMLYAQIEKIRINNIGFTAGFQPIKRGDTPVQNTPEITHLNTAKVQKVVSLITDFSLEEKQEILNRIEIYLAKENISQALKNELLIIRLGVKLSM